MGRAAPEKTPRDKVIHPIYRYGLPAEVLPETKVEPAYPEKWRELRLGAQVILQVVIDKLGNVTKVDLLKTKLRVETDCAKDSGDQVAPPEAARDFEAAAISAVKQWKFRPGTQSGVPVDVFQTLIIDFTLCPKSTGAGPPPIR